MNASLLVETQHHESTLGSWTSSRWIPTRDDALFGFVERIWDFEGALTYRQEQTFPSGTFELTVQLDEPHRSVGGAISEIFPAICLDGLQTSTATIQGPRGLFRVLGITLHPPGAFALLGTSLHQLTDCSIDLCAAIGRPAAQLAERLDEQRQSAARVRTADAWVRERFARARGVDPIIAEVFDRIRSGGGRIAIAEIEGLDGRSRSRLAQRFREQVGLAPKRYARVVRFQRVLEILGAIKSGASLSSLALAAGYYDQAHMNADFREFADTTPRRYVGAIHFPEGTHLAHLGEAEAAGLFFQESASAFV